MAADPSVSKTRLLAQLVDEERSVSAARRRLQDRIDYFAGAGDVDTAAALRQREGELSARRRELHAEIDALQNPSE